MKNTEVAKENTLSAKEKKPKITAIFIAYKAAKTLEKFYKEFPKELVDEMILVDDASGDGTYELSQKLGITSFRNPVNLGYGGNMKRAIEIALERGANIIIDIHPDGEYKPSAIHAALEKVREGASLVLGNRFTASTNPLARGMFVWKVGPIIFLNWLARMILRLPIHDFHQGFRVYTRKLLETAPYEKNSNNYLFSFELIAQAAYSGLPVREVPVETNYSGEKRGASLKSSIRYSLGTFKIMTLYLLAKAGMKTELFPCRR